MVKEYPKVADVGAGSVVVVGAFVVGLPEPWRCPAKAGMVVAVSASAAVTVTAPAPMASRVRFMEGLLGSDIDARSEIGSAEVA
jgi:hypothetical protein